MDKGSKGRKINLPEIKETKITNKWALHYVTDKNTYKEEEDMLSDF